MQQQAIEIRQGALSDAPFLAYMDREASIPPFAASFWDELLKPTGTDTLAFLELMFRRHASNWGNAEDFLILELNGRPAACCSVFRPTDHGALGALEGPLRLDALGSIAAELGWSDRTSAAFKGAYRKDWQGDPGFMKPQAEVIVETVAVVPEFRGRGLGHALMKAAFAKGRELGADSIGIMVVNGNDAAERLYEKYFEPYVTYHSAYFDNQFPGLTKFRATLRPTKGKKP